MNTDLKGLLYKLSEERIRRCFVVAVNKTVRKYSRVFVRVLGRKSRIPQKLLSERVWVQKAVTKNPEAVFSFISDFFPAASMGVKKQDRRGVRAGRIHYRSAFIARVRGKEGVWRRVGKSPYPIKRVGEDLTPEAKAALAGLIPKIEQDYMKTLEGELRKYLDK